MKKVLEDKEIAKTLKKITSVSGRNIKDTKPWNPAKYKCLDCNSVLFSKYPGQFVECKCEKCFVDQTRYYVRIGGSPVLLEEEKEE